jgi:protein TonB
MRLAISGTSPRTLVAAVVVVMIALIAGVLWQISAHASKAEPSDGTNAATATIAAAQDTGPDSPIGLLLGLARTAVSDKRLIAPQGNNAFEYYLSVLDLDKNNTNAQEALRESFPIASEQIERSILDKDLDEAQREIMLLREFDADNYVLLILGAKLDAQRKLVTAEDEAHAVTMRKAAQGTF